MPSRKTFRRFVIRVVNLLRRAREEDGLASELASHLAFLEEDFRARGMAPEAARRAARLALGGVEQVTERHRDARSFRWIEDAWRDVAIAVRLLRRNPIMTATAALSLAIGIGANTAVFTVAHALLFRAPAGIVDADRLVDIGVSRGDGGFNPGSYPTYQDLRRRATTLDGLFAHAMFPKAMSLAVDEAPGRVGGSERVFGHRVTTNYFTVLGAKGRLGPTVRRDGQRAARCESRRRAEPPLLDAPLQPRFLRHRPHAASQWTVVRRHRRRAGRLLRRRSSRA